jgi:hypothetical protein
MTLLTTSQNEIPEHSAWHDISGAIMTIVISFVLMFVVNYLLH